VLVRPAGEDRSPSDAVLVERALAGERGAEEALYVRHVSYINALCMRLLGSRQEAEDATQDTFVDLLEQLGKLRDPSSVRAWLARIAVHKVHRRFRRRKLLRTLGLDRTEYDAAAALPARTTASPEHVAELTRLAGALNQLPDTIRAAWLLRYVDGHRLEDVASLTACSLATVKRRVSEADRVVRAHASIAEDDDE
jgi:RNA polymerase sigma-70 factor, ECF subfamily